MDAAHDQGVQIVAFPELALCGYPPEDLLYKEHFVRDNRHFLKSIAKKVFDLTAIVGFVDHDRNKQIYNAAAILADGEIKAIYHKRALPNYGVFDEKRYFSSGKGKGDFSISGLPFSVSICEDIWEEVKTSKASSQLSLQINISSSPYDTKKIHAREKVLKHRARKTNAYICYTNLVGGQDLFPTARR